MTPEQLIKEKWEDMKKSPIEQTDTSENRLREFNKWLQTEFKGRKGKPLAPSSALAVCAGIADFYSRNRVPLNIKLTQEFAGAKKGINETEKMSAEQIETLASYAPTLRDKAIIWCTFQGGMDVSTGCSLNWGHVEKEIENPPMSAILLRMLERKKEKGRTFDTLIYKTAIKHLKIYLKDRYGEDYAKKLKYDTPLFVNLYGPLTGKRLQPRYVQRMLRKIAPHTGLATSRMKLSDINPLRPHAMRASFSDQMAKAGASKQLVDYLMGHKLNFDKAYFGGEEGLREAYVRYAKEALEPTGITKFDESIEKLRGVVGEQADLISRMKLKVEQFEKRMARYEAFTKKFMEMTPEEMEEIGKEFERKRRERVLKEHKEI